MTIIQYPPLLIRGFLLEDMKPLLEGEVDVRASSFDFALVCEGDPQDGTPPTYGRSARTVWRLDGVDRQPPPYVNVFDWGGHFFGLPTIRVWFVQQGAGEPLGIGAFKADKTDTPFPERETIRDRLAELLGAPGCYLVSEL